MADNFAISVRFLKAINLLASPQGTTIKGLEERLGISRRSVFRLLAFLEEMGLPIIDEQQGHKTKKTYKLLDSYILKLPNIIIPNPCFSEEELKILISLLDNNITKDQASSATVLKSIKRKILNMTST